MARAARCGGGANPNPNPNPNPTTNPNPNPNPYPYHSPYPYPNPNPDPNPNPNPNPNQAPEALPPPSETGDVKEGRSVWSKAEDYLLLQQAEQVGRPLHRLHTACT